MTEIAAMLAALQRVEGHLARIEELLRALAKALALAEEVQRHRPARPSIYIE